MPRRDDDDGGPIQVNPHVDAAFTAVFFLETAAVFAALLTESGQLGLGRYSPSTAASALAGSIAAVFALIQLVKRTARASGALLSRRIFPGDPLAKRRTMHKFEDQMWQLVVHASMAALEAYILFYRAVEESRSTARVTADIHV